MARLKDWINLGKTTVSSLRTSDVTDLYSTEWPETQKMLIADHREEIDAEPRCFKRWLRIASAVLYGLAQRLAPHRRVIFLVAWIVFFFSSFSRFDGRTWQLSLAPIVAFLAMTFLLALELIDKLKYRDELELARDLQAGLIPKNPPQTAHFEIAAFNVIANTVGGDIYDFIELADGRVAILFGDASGHGMAAGLVMAVAHAAFRTQLDIDPSADAIVASLNRILCRTGGSRSFFSCCYVLLAPDGTFSATFAGHPPLLKIGRDGRVIERIGRGSYPLGVKTGLRWEPIAGALEKGERLLFHSDGLTEARNPTGREFGDVYVEAICGWHPGEPAAGTVDSLVSEWKFFIGRKPPEDDMSIVAVVAR
ncbi:MAG TPA: PP2C family protein-serine/threonine phosphatase [Thermoanaerobaculia bacterium]|nr:PP2C family protein-serine/threonine phosphatase [Thermoanaerobaculia bacterium]